MTIQFDKNLPKGTMFTAKSLGHAANKSAAMKRIMQDKSVASVLNQSVERKEFFKALEKETGGRRNVKKDDVRKVLGDFRSGHGHYIDKSEAQKMAGQFFGGSMEKKYIFTHEDKSKADDSAKNSPVTNLRHGAVPAAKGKSSLQKELSARPRFF